MITWQPHLIGSSIRLRPLIEADFDALFSAASDPLIWELHPDNKRYTRERFEVYFRTAIESNGALAIIDLKTGNVIGSSRYTEYNPQNSSVEIGFTFLTRDYWGGTYNRELKSLMMGYAFQHVETAYFVVGRDNYRSRRAMLKIGGVEVMDLSSTPVTHRANPLLSTRSRKQIGVSRTALSPLINRSLKLHAFILSLSVNFMLRNFGNSSATQSCITSFHLNRCP